MTPFKFAMTIHRIAAALRTEIIAAEALTLEQARDALIKRSSGTITTKALRTMGHPYAVRDPQTPLDPSLINAQSGDFKRSWKKTGPKSTIAGVVSSVVNTDPKAKYMFGTRKMVARRVDIYVAAQMAPRRRFHLDRGVRRALRKR